jgi:nucleobase:cation symporter-1, NCS1 family
VRATSYCSPWAYQPFHNSVNLYSGPMATLTCDVKLPQWVTVTIAGVIGLVIAVVFGGD